MSLKDSLMKKIETQSEYWSKKIEQIRADAEAKKAEAKDQQAEAEIEQKATQQLQGLERQVKEAKSRLQELQEAGEERADEMKDDVESWLARNRNKESGS
ncbi:hypothetical protein SAMN05216203_1169 [Marinobacter daqiaonensis]|uniref:Uncharacterized protein n=1 Tax=Marinobacter daqiaonensis TaxID=650891 RepID=A0A1I6HEY4_9GAMM|nr:hypothetical protein [Marinobacter daqiaonensis]SFR52900.1 hypothetical protein SAMN05216203_1169 [Marinobacter daqiaonensis]